MPRADKLRELLARGDWEHVASLLERLDAPVAGDALLSVPQDRQQSLFRSLPVEAAARVAATLPYYDAYVLLHSRPLEEMRAIVGRMEIGERLRFFDELPELAWQRFMDELGEPQPAGPPAAAIPSAPVTPVIEARQIEKSYDRPGGGQVQVIAPTNLSIEPGLIIAMLGPSGSGKSTLLCMLSGLAPPTKGEVLWHVLLGLIRLGGGLGIGSIVLLLLGTQWYILFNVIAGASAIPTDLKEVCDVCRLHGAGRWRKLLLPGIFPFLITGFVTASGGAWNASIVAEYFRFHGRTYSTTGLGAVISRAADRGDFAVLLGATLTMAVIVVTVNRLLWRRLYALASTRFKLEV